jgi:two-component system KDP operon response regulator KdpE
MRSEMGLEPEPAPADVATVSAHVLVVDDQPEIRRVLELGLGGEGFDVLTAANAEDGLDWIRSASPTVVILDLMMPMRDGWWFLGELERMGVERPAVIILSARSGEAEQIIARRLGAEEYVTKPFDIDHVARLVRRHMGAAGDASYSTGTTN